MEKKVHCFCKDQGGNHGIHTKGISWMYLNKKKCLYWTLRKEAAR